MGLTSGFSTRPWTRIIATRRPFNLPCSEWAEVFRAPLPRIDAVFVPGGDPGHTQPKHLLPRCSKHKRPTSRSITPEPRCGFRRKASQPWLDEFVELIKQEPSWLDGVVYGPQVRIDLPALRSLIPARYPARDYPDITHSRHCQFPVPNWDLAFALTEGREVANPRPEQMAGIFRRSRPHTIGFIGYSEGCHDDLNKMLWLALGWDERADVRNIVRDYARYFIGSAYESEFTQGLLGLEKNWEGSALANPSIENTLESFRTIVRKASPELKRNWRYQLAIYRAYYDGYLQARLRAEARRVAEARTLLRNASALGSFEAVGRAEAILNQTTSDPEIASRRARVGELAEAAVSRVSSCSSVFRSSRGLPSSAVRISTWSTPRSAMRVGFEPGWAKSVASTVNRPGSPGSMRCSTERTPAPVASTTTSATPKTSRILSQDWEPSRTLRSMPQAWSASDSEAQGRTRRPTRPGGTMPSRFTTLRSSCAHTDLDHSAVYRVRVVYAHERQTAKTRLMADDQFENPWSPWPEHLNLWSSPCLPQRLPTEP